MTRACQHLWLCLFGVIPHPKINRYFFANRSLFLRSISQLIIGAIKRDDDWNQLNPSLIVSYDILDNLNVYAKWVTGYRAGGFNARGSETFFGTPFDEGTLTSFEVGAKSDGFDNRLRVNLAVFSMDYEDLRVDQSDPVNIALTRVVNAGTAKMNGANSISPQSPWPGSSLKCPGPIWMRSTKSF